MRRELGANADGAQGIGVFSEAFQITRLTNRQASNTTSVSKLEVHSSHGTNLGCRPSQGETH